MKLSRFWLFTTTFYLTLIIFLTKILLSVTFPPELTEGLISVYSMLIFLDIAFILFFLLNFLIADVYKKIIYVPKSDFKITKFKNFDVWEYGDNSLIPYNREKMNKKDKIKITYTYTITKKDNGHIISGLSSGSGVYK